MQWQCNVNVIKRTDRPTTQYAVTGKPEGAGGAPSRQPTTAYCRPGRSKTSPNKQVVCWCVCVCVCVYCASPRAVKLGFKAKSERSERYTDHTVTPAHPQGVRSYTQVCIGSPHTLSHPAILSLSIPWPWSIGWIEWTDLDYEDRHGMGQCERGRSKL